VIITYNEDIISLKSLISIHLKTHAATSNHSFRTKYRSAVYIYDAIEKNQINNLLTQLQTDFELKLVTQVLLIDKFQESRESLRNYYEKNPEAPFCQRYIEPKLALIDEKIMKKKK
ncbi:MAG: peptide-methionine (S)-S-oxide reductase, partial [Leeuwenhoekiella sp.]